MNWKPVVGYEETYSVSDEGHVRRDAAGKGAVAGYVLKNTIMKSNGYLRVGLVVDGQQVTRTVHTLVAEAFLGKPTWEGVCVNHKDGNKLNNSVANLEYLTLAANNTHAAANGLTYKKTHCKHGHELTADNVRLTFRKGTGERVCLKCQRRRHVDHKSRQKSLASLRASS